MVLSDNEKEDSRTDSTDIKRIMKKCQEWIYVNKFEDLGEMD